QPFAPLASALPGITNGTTSRELNVTCRSFAQLRQLPDAMLHACGSPQRNRPSTSRISTSVSESWQSPSASIQPTGHDDSIAWSGPPPFTAQAPSSRHKTMPPNRFPEDTLINRSVRLTQVHQ